MHVELIVARLTEMRGAEAEPNGHAATVAALEFQVLLPMARTERRFASVGGRVRRGPFGWVCGL